MTGWNSFIANHTGAKILKIHILNISLFTKFTFSKSHFSQNPYFSNIIFLVISGQKGGFCPSVLTWWPYRIVRIPVNAGFQRGSNTLLGMYERFHDLGNNSVLHTWDNWIDNWEFGKESNTFPFLCKWGILLCRIAFTSLLVVALRAQDNSLSRATCKAACEERTMADFFPLEFDPYSHVGIRRKRRRDNAIDALCLTCGQCLPCSSPPKKAKNKTEIDSKSTRFYVI